jgi:chemotaxis protein MotB
MQNKLLLILIVSGFVLSSCASKKELRTTREELVLSTSELQMTKKKLRELSASLEESQTINLTCEQEKEKLEIEINNLENKLDLREGQIADLKDQIADYKKQRDRQLDQVGDLTVLSKSANENIKETLQQMEKKDRYIQMLNAAKSKADSINLALAMNLKSVLRDGIDDKDIEINVDKTVVFVNLSDKMLYQSGSASLTPRAHEVLGKIAQIIKSRPDLEIMVEGYTDNVPIKGSCIEDNWDLSVKRATSVVRLLQQKYSVDPNKLIAAGRGEYNALADNGSDLGRATNRRTRIIILPKLNQFYDLLKPNKEL